MAAPTTTFDIESISKKTGLSPVELRSKVQSYGPQFALSTGSLTLDLVLGGGVPYGRFIVYSGMESSGKSTILYSTLLQAVLDERYNESVKLFFDHEGTMTFDYLAGIARRAESTLLDLFSERKVLYFEPETGDASLKTIRYMLKLMPEFARIDGQWWKVYPKQKTKKATKEIIATEPDYDKTLTAKTGRVHVPVERPYPTLIAFIDSLAAMFPETLEDNEDSNKPGAPASMFSRWLSSIKPLLSSRMAMIIATNQLRERPMVMFGSPIYEPGGNAIKFYSDVRVRINAKGKIEEIDPNTYRFSKVQTIKNKVFVPFRESMIRLWLSDKFGRPRGIDPVFDVITYLKETDQVRRSAGRYKLLLPPPFHGLVFTEQELAKCVIDPINLFVLGKLPVPDERVARLVELYKESEYLTPAQRDYVNQFSIQALCRTQIETKEAIKRYMSKDEAEGGSSYIEDGDGEEEE